MKKKRVRKPTYPLPYDEDERAIWERAARGDNRSLANWIRTTLTEAAKRQIEDAKKH